MHPKLLPQRRGRRRRGCDVCSKMTPFSVLWNALSFAGEDVETLSERSRPSRTSRPRAFGFTQGAGGSLREMAAADLTQALQRAREIEITVTGRRSGRAISNPVWFVEERDTLYL